MNLPAKRLLILFFFIPAFLVLNNCDSFPPNSSITSGKNIDVLFQHGLSPGDKNKGTLTNKVAGAKKDILRTAPVSRETQSAGLPWGNTETPSLAKDLLQNAIVYVRVARTQGPVNIIHADQSGGTSKGVVQSPDAYDILPDSRHIKQGFNAPGQLVYLPADGGKEKILFNCVGKRRACVPLDPSVSLDGKKVIFSVYWSDNLGHRTVGATTLPNTVLGNKNMNAQIFIVEIASGVLESWPQITGVHDMSPIWLPNGRIMFSSTRAKTAPPWLRGMTAPSTGIPQLFTAKADGTDVINISPHELATAMHPYLLNGGNVAYSSFWRSHNLAYWGTNGSINWPTTLANNWMVSDIDIYGRDTTALLGAHRAKAPKFLNGAYWKVIKALHFIGQRKNNDICVANYYRANNLGLGDVLCWPPEPKGVEGQAKTFLPRNLYDVARWATSDDDLARKGPSGTFFGKIGYPEGIANNQLMLTFGQGFCLSQTLGGNLKTRDKLAATQPNKRACDAGIYKTTMVPSLHPQDLVAIVDSPLYHEFSARSVVARDIPHRKKKSLDGNRCTLASSDAGSHELTPPLRYKFNKNYMVSANNGGKIAGLVHSELAAIRFWEVLPNQGKKPRNYRNVIGNKLKLLGDVDLLSDNSFIVELPCDTPYIMAGIDSNGLVIMRDQVAQSLRPGEQRVCLGCHLHSKKGRPYEKSQAYSASPTVRRTSKPVPVFDNDIEDIFARRCLECHSGTPNAENYIALTNYDLLVWDFLQKSVPKSKKIIMNAKTGNKKKKYGMQRPYTSKYVNSMFARESLLYWKAAGKRVDGRTDETYKVNASENIPNDIDYGEQIHPASGLTATELRRIGLWLDSGAPRN